MTGERPRLAYNASSMCRSFLVALGLAMAGCTGDLIEATALDCTTKPYPEPPELVLPLEGALDVAPDALLMQAAGLDPRAVRTEYELWSLDDGELDTLVWRATAVAPGELGAVTLASGQRVNGTTDLEPFGRYAVRVRQVIDLDGCERPSDYSPLTTFRIDDGSTALFADDAIRQVELELTPETIAALDAQAIPPGCVPFEREYHPGNVIIDGVRYDGVGVKTKGGCGSARSMGGKAGFKIKLDWQAPGAACPPRRHHGGQSTLTLNNMVQDGSYAHERLGYALYRAMGVPVPRVSTVQVAVNGEVFGLYTHLETHGRRMLRRHFSEADGMLYEGTYWCDVLADNVRDDDSGCLTREFRPDVCDGAPDPGDDPQDYVPLRTLIAALDALPEDMFYPMVQSIIDWDAFLTMWATDAVIGHWDGHEFGIMNNYRIYHDPDTDLWTFMPSGIDQTFSQDLDPWAVSARLPARCLQVPACEAAFAAKLAAAADQFEAMNLRQRAAAIHAQLRPLLIAEPARNVDLDTFDGRHADTAAFIDGRPARIREHLAAHGF
jgi:hypothetical protein